MIKREIHTSNSTTVYVSFLGDDQVHLTVSTPDRDIDPHQACTDAYRAISEILTGAKMRIVHERIFGSEAVDALMAARKAGLAGSEAERDLPVTFREICEELGLTEMPHVLVVADACRDKLLFEMDAFAAFDPR